MSQLGECLPVALASALNVSGRADRPSILAHKNDQFRAPHRSLRFLLCAAETFAQEYQDDSSASNRKVSKNWNGSSFFNLRRAAVQKGTEACVTASQFLISGCCVQWSFQIQTALHAQYRDPIGERPQLCPPFTP